MTTTICSKSYCENHFAICFVSHVPAIQEIVHCAQLELQLEEKFFSIQEEWSEQNLRFQHYKSHGPILLDIDHTHSLLEQLEHAQMELANMLMSRHIQPLKEEAIQWAAKLSSLADILQQVSEKMIQWNLQFKGHFE